VKTFERVNGVTVPHRFVARRQGDVAACWADATRANNLLGWHAKLGLEAMCRDAWRWHLSGNAAANP
jgi:UDP-glucose 4-epimerase